MQPNCNRFISVIASGPQAIVNRAQADDGQQVLEAAASTIANGFPLHLPVIRK